MNIIALTLRFTEMQQKGVNADFQLISSNRNIKVVMMEYTQQSSNKELKNKYLRNTISIFFISS